MKRRFHFSLVFAIEHIDKVDDNQAAKVTKFKLAGNLFCGFNIGIERRIFNVRAFCRATRVDIDRD